MVAGLSGMASAQCTVVPGATWGVPGSGSGVFSEVFRLRSWDPDGPGPQTAVALATGAFPPTGSAGGSCLAVHDPVLGTWSPVGAWTFGRGQACAVFANGDLAASAMDFTSGQAAVARWNGSTWTQLGGTFDSQVVDLAVAPNGDLYAGGYFQSVGGTPMASVARWDGFAWQPVGGGQPPVDELVMMPNGDLVAGGFGGIQRWNGSTWSSLGFGFAFLCSALELLPSGDLLASGDFATAVGRWNGTAWTWIALPAGSMRAEAIHELPNGDLLVVGAFHTATSACTAMRWNGATWQPLTMVPPGYAAWCVLGLADGEVMVGGTFGSTAALGAITLTTTCPAGSASLGPGCTSSGGGNVLTAGLVWTGGLWSANATGLPLQSFVLLVDGFTAANLPLGSLLPQGQPGCTLRVQPDHTVLLPSVGGQASAAFAIPSSPLLTGLVFHSQMVALEFGAGPAILSATVTNAITRTVGTF